MYRIIVDARVGLVEATLDGLLTVQEVAKYMASLQHEFVTHKLRTYAMIIDVTACPIQHQDVIAAMGEHMAKLPKARAIAVVTGSSLARMQSVASSRRRMLVSWKTWQAREHGCLLASSRQVRSLNVPIA